MQLKCLVVDDEPLSVRVMQKYIEQHPRLVLAGICHDGLQAMEFLQRGGTDLMFLDIDMPRLSGISLLKSLTHPPLVVISTAYPEYAVEGFELEVTDYLLKPFSFERFAKAVARALEKREMRAPVVSAPDHHFFKADKKLYRVELDDLLYLQAYGDYVKVFTRNRRLIVKERLSQIEAQLPPDQFLRIHRSCVIALDKIEYLEGNQVKIGEEKLTIGASFREELMKRLE